MAGKSKLTKEKSPPAAQAAPAPASDAGSASSSKLGDVLQTINSASLSSGEMTTVLHHVAMQLSMQNVARSLPAGQTLADSGYCCTLPADGSIGTLYKDGDYQGPISKEEAFARNIPEC